MMDELSVSMKLALGALARNEVCRASAATLRALEKRGLVADTTRPRLTELGRRVASGVESILRPEVELTDADLQVLELLERRYREEACEYDGSFPEFHVGFVDRKWLQERLGRKTVKLNYTMTRLLRSGRIIDAPGKAGRSYAYVPSRDAFDATRTTRAEYLRRRDQLVQELKSAGVAFEGPLYNPRDRTDFFKLSFEALRTLVGKA